MAKVSKNQRVNRGADPGAKQMAKIIVASKKDNGAYEFRQRMVEADRVQEELAAAKEN